MSTHAPRQIPTSVMPARRAGRARIGASNDALEHEADHVAQHVAADLVRPDPHFAPPAISALATPVEAPGSEAPRSVDEALSSTGIPLMPDVRDAFERRFAHDFSRVRVHTDPVAARSASELGAQAYTAGPHIVFAEGKFDPARPSGMRLLAHELTHVAQQSALGARADRVLVQRKPDSGAVPVFDAVEARPAPPVSPAPEARTPAPLDSTRFVDAPTKDPSTRPSPEAPAPASSPAVPVLPRAPTDRAPPPLAPTAESLPQAPSEQGDLSMPQLGDLLAPATAMPLDGAAPEATVDTGPLFSRLAQATHQTREAVDENADLAASALAHDVGLAQGRLTHRTRRAKAAVHALCEKRRDELTITVRAHKGAIDFSEQAEDRLAIQQAVECSDAMREGFGIYRASFADAFDVWGRNADRITQEQSTRLTRDVNESVRHAQGWAIGYRSYVNSLGGQSEGKKDVQRIAADEVVDAYIDGILATKRDALPELAKGSEQIKVVLDKARDEALVEFDKGLPAVLQSIQEQLFAARLEIKQKAGECRTLLDTASTQMHGRIDTLEEKARTHDVEIQDKFHAAIDARGGNAAREVRKARKDAMEPIARKLDESVGLLSKGDELDPEASTRFVDEVAAFALGAAEGTSEVFTAAADAGRSSLASADPAERREFATVRNGLAVTLKSEGIEDEATLLEFNADVDAYLHSPVTDLIEEFKALSRDADTRLSDALAETRERMREPMLKAEEDVKKSYNAVMIELAEGRSKYMKAAHNAALRAKWEYEHPVLNVVAQVVEVAMGFAVVVAVLVAIVLGLPLLLGEALGAAVLYGLMLLGAFAAGYFGAKSYYERRQKQQGVVASLFGAVADVTGITEARRAFTDSTMAPFERGMAWGQAWLGLFGLAEGAPRFLRAVKMRLPKRFTNPFRGRGSVPSLMPETPGLGVPREPIPAVPEVPKLGFELPHQQLPEGGGPPATPRAKSPIGYEVGDRGVPAAAPEAGGVTPRLHHRKPAIAEGAPVEKGPIGFKGPEQGSSAKPRAEGAAPPVRKKIGFEIGDRATPPVEAPPIAEAPIAAESGPGSGVIDDMPRAREVQAPKTTGAGRQQTRMSAGDAPLSEGPVKGSVATTVEAETPRAASTDGAAVTESRVGDEPGMPSPRERRIAAEERVAKLEKEVEEAEAMQRELGRKRQRDYIDDHVDKTRGELRDAKNELRRSSDAEAKAQAAEPVATRPKEVDPAAAVHDPAVKAQALEEKAALEQQIERNNESIRANDKALERAQNRLELRREELYAKPHGDPAEGEAGRALAEARAAATERVRSAERHLESVENRTKNFREANDRHNRRLHQLDRTLHPEKYPQLSGEKGDFAELATHKEMAKNDYELRGSSKESFDPEQSRAQGLDGVYEKANPAKGEARHVVGESKYDTSRLRPGQDELQWVDARLDHAVGPKHAQRMREEGYEYWVYRYDPKAGRIVGKKLWEWVPSNRVGPNGRILGSVRYAPLP